MTENKILLVRHGESAANAGQMTTFNDKIPLSALGEKQSAAIAQKLFAREPNPAKLISSPYLRAVETAAPYAKLTEAKIEIADAWHETDYLQAQENAAPTTLEQRFNARNNFWTESIKNQDFHDPGEFAAIESVNDFCGRIETALADLAREILAEKPTREIVIFTHGNLMNALFLRLAGKSPREVAEWFYGENLQKRGGSWVRNCQVVELTFDGAKFTISRRDVFPESTAETNGLLVS